MARKDPFTSEQIQVLSQNPYTHSVSPARIAFTLAFKEFFCEQARIPGMTTRKIFLEAGYNPDWFSKASLDAIRKRILREVSSPEGLKPPRGLGDAERTALFAKKDLSKQRTDTTIRQLQERIVHLEQQIEFLKKISHLRKPD